MGRKSHEDNVYYKSKGQKLKKKTYNDNPIKGAPGTYIDFYDLPSGRIIRRRVLDTSGNVSKDYDEPHVTHSKQNHIHNWFTKNGKTNKDVNFNLTKKERNMFKKMRKKRLKKGENNE